MCIMKPLTPALALLMSLVLALASTEMVTFYGSEVDDDVPHVRHRRTIQGDPARRWDQGIIPYVIYDNVKSTIITEIYRAIHTYERFTCLRFVPMVFRADNTSTYDDYAPPLTQGYIRFVKGSGCASYGCGKMGNSQGQRVSCCACLHELGHALGFIHETKSLEPAKKWMIRYPGPQFGGDYSKYIGPKDPSERLSLAGYMRKSYMHAGARMNEKVVSNIDFYPEQRWFEKGIYYQMMEIDMAHDCAALRGCDKLGIQCENEGYLSEIDYKCQCNCVAGLDPSTGCTDVVNDKTPTQKFPGGSYALLKTKAGCPVDFVTGSIGSTFSGEKKRVSQSSNSTRFDLSSTFGVPDIVQEFCVTDETADENKDIWPMGRYCIFRKGGSCPNRFTPGSVLYTGFARSEVSGTPPDYDEAIDDTKLFFCCRNDTAYVGTHMNLPNRKPFALIKLLSEPCGEVRGMHVYEQSYSLRNAKSTTVGFGRKAGYKMVETIVCYYQPAKIDCGEYHELSADTRTVTFFSPVGKDLQCSWFIKAPKGHRLSLKFDSFDVPCIDRNRIDIRYFRPGQEGINFCTNSKTNFDMARTIQSTNDTISIQLNTYGNSNVAFTATVTLILNEELCYNTKDHGVSYAGKVNFTRFFEPCLPWADVSHCRYNPYKPHPGSESINAILEGNYCRNPDYETGIMPWCYYEAEKCLRNYCDPCQLGTVHDTAANCDATVRDGACGTGVDTLATGCAKSCNFQVPTFDLPQASTVACDPPLDDVVDGKLIDDDNLATYPVGSKVTYQCSNSAAETRDRTCLTSGQWSPLGTVCDVCNPGWAFKAGTDSCYKYFDDMVSLHNARIACETYDGGHLPTPKNEAETKLVWEAMWTNPRPNSVWLPMTDNEVEGEWLWDGGEAVEWVIVPPRITDKAEDEDEDDVIIDEPKKKKIGNKKDCAMVTMSGQWEHTFCKQPNSYVCVMPPAKLATCVDFFEGCEAALIAKPNVCSDEPEFALRMCPDTCKKCVDRTERELIKLLTNLLHE